MERAPYDPSGGRASYWVEKAAHALDCAMQCAPDQRASDEIDELETRCDDLAAELKKRYS